MLLFTFIIDLKSTVNYIINDVVISIRSLPNKYYFFDLFSFIRLLKLNLSVLALR